jgi:hypothetical protein
VVPYNPEIAILWRASHNVQKVSKHGFEQYLAKYISKPEPSLNIQLPENASEPQRFLRTRVIGSVEALEVLMGFHQSQMSRQVIFLQTELNPTQRMLKPSFQLKDMQDDDTCRQNYRHIYKGLLPSMVLPTQNFTDGGVQPPQLSRGKP